MKSLLGTGRLTNWNKGMSHCKNEAFIFIILNSILYSSPDLNTGRHENKLPRLIHVGQAYTYTGPLKVWCIVSSMARSKLQ